MLSQVVDQKSGEIFETMSREIFTPATGQIVPWHEHAYRNLEEAEKSIYELIDEGEHLRLRQVKILLAIQDQQLYRERVDLTTGQPFNSFDAYLKKFLSSSAAFSGDAPRTLRSWLSRYLVYVEGLSLPEEELVEMGSHLEVSLPLAAKDRKCQLQEDNEDLPTGGVRLGRKEFSNFIKDIEQKVQDSRDNPTVSELHWTVRHTKDAVEEIMGTANSKCNFELDGTLVGDQVRWNKITAFVGDIQYQPGNLVPLDAWIILGKGHKVVGVEG